MAVSFVIEIDAEDASKRFGKLPIIQIECY
jgi:hypothetical protein